MKIRINKWPLICSTLLFFGMFSLETQTVNAQILIQEAFNDDVLPIGWSFTSIFEPSSEAPCEGAGSARVVLSNFFYRTGYAESPVWTSNGENINVTFSFKLLQEEYPLNPPNVGTPISDPGWGSMRLQLSADGGDNYTTVFVIDDDNYTPSTECSQYSHTIDGNLLPDSSFLKLRWFGRNEYGNSPDFFVYLDDITIQQEGTFDCPEVFANVGHTCDDGDIYTIGTTIDANCECTGTTVVFEGCNTGTSGDGTMYPGCSGPLVNSGTTLIDRYISVLITDLNVSYEFFTSNPDYFITITTIDGSTILAYGQGTVTYTPTESGFYRFYTNASPDCPPPSFVTVPYYTRNVLPGVCDFDCPDLEAYIGDYCAISCSGDSYSQTVSTEAVGGSGTFGANPEYTVSVPPGFTGDYTLNVTADGEVLSGKSSIARFRVQIIDPNGVNVTDGAPGGNPDEWRPSGSTNYGPFTGSLNVGNVTDPSGDWTVLVRLASEFEDQAIVDITLSFQPGQAGTINEDCACLVPGLSEGGELTVNGSSAVCFEEGSSDPVTFGNAVLTGEAGDNSLWVLTPGSSLSVLATDASGPNFDLSGLAEGLYRIWHVSYTNNVDINDVLGNINTPGCWDASNPVNIVVAYSPVGGTISTNSITTVCTGQGIPSGILATYEGEGAMYLRWVLTDESGTEIGRRTTNSLFNFDSLTPGIYRIYHVASATTAANLNSSTDISDLGPCASVSNFIEVTAIDCSGSAQLTSQPSPTSGISMVSFSVDNGQKVQLEVFDLSGRQISTLFNQDANGAQNYTMQFDGSGLPNGVYIYRMTTESEVIIDKFMIAR